MNFFCRYMIYGVKINVWIVFLNVIVFYKKIEILWICMYDYGIEMYFFKI